MSNSFAERLDEDEYFTDINYELYSDEELDDLYHYGTIRSPRKRRKASGRSSANDASHKLHLYDDDWPDVDFDPDDDLGDYPD